MKYSVLFTILMVYSVIQHPTGQAGTTDDCYGKTCKPGQYCSEAEINKRCMNCTHLQAWCPNSDKIAEKYPQCAYVCQMKKYREDLNNIERSYRRLESDYATFRLTALIGVVAVGVLSSVLIVSLVLCLCRYRRTNAKLRKNAGNRNAVSTARPQNNTKKSLLRSLCFLCPSSDLRVVAQPEPGLEGSSPLYPPETQSPGSATQDTTPLIAQPDSERPSHREGDNITSNTIVAVVDETERPKMQRNSGSIADDSGNDSSKSSPTFGERKAVMVAPTGDRTEHDQGDQNNFMKYSEIAV